MNDRILLILLCTKAVANQNIQSDFHQKKETVIQI